jgi:hypothetical protein
VLGREIRQKVDLACGRTKFEPGMPKGGITEKASTITRMEKLQLSPRLSSCSVKKKLVKKCDLHCLGPTLKVVA